MKPSKTWNQHVVKRENKSLVLETIKQNSPISRANVAKITGLNKGTVSSLVSELITKQIIYESGPGESRGGRRPVMLLFSKKAGFSIGIDLGVNYILGILTDLEGNIVHEKMINIKVKDLTYEETQNNLYNMIDSFQNIAPTSPYGIIGIGIGIPGIVNTAGKILLAPNLGWRNINLKTIMSKKYNIPIIIENEANAGAYAEQKYGAGKNLSNIIYVSVGVGIGVGMILGGELYKGKSGFSGEFGHMTIETNGKKCSCGSQGCWELYASEQTLIDGAKNQGIHLASGKVLSLESLLLLAEEGNRQTIQLFNQIGDYLGVGLNNIINIFNPEQVIIGNQMAQAKKWIHPALTNRLGSQALWFQQKDLKINYSSLSAHSTALGMTVFSLNNFFNNHLGQNE
ncbi:MAG TPA: ROK family protein [Virgibacillus sp.]|nr:ROK family protein [Virgibacillus sp.]